MAKIQSTTGLATGIDIQSTVDSLMKVAARPRDLIVSRTKSISEQQGAVTTLTALALSLQFSMRKLAETTPFQTRNVTSSNSSLLSATATGTPANGSYTFTPLQKAQNHQLLSSGTASLDAAVGIGSLSFSYGGFADEGLSLDLLNEGAGVQRGKIRIQDRAGDSAVIDLRAARTVDDVIAAINSADGIRVKAEAVGDSFKLTDETGETVKNLRVSEVGGGSTASDLGLAGVDVAASTATGNDVLRLYGSMNLKHLNGGTGLSVSNTLTDLEISYRDGTTKLIDFNTLGRPADKATATTTAVNGTHAKIKFTAKANGGTLDNVRIEFVDSGNVTKGSETVVYDDSDPDDKVLRIDIDAGQTNANDVIAAIAGDADVGALFAAAKASGSAGTGLIDLADTAVTTGGAEVPAKTEVTLEDIITTINASDPTRIEAKLSASCDRIELKDLTVGGGTFKVENSFGGTTADDLGLTGEAVGDTIASRRLIGGLKDSLLANLNGGQGLGELGEIDITDRSGATATVDLSGAERLTDVITAINAAGIGVRAEFNSARNGLKIVDTTGSVSDNLKIENGDSTDTAEALKIEFDAAKNSVDSGSLARQTLSEQTRLDSLNGGKGISLGSFIVTDSDGLAKAVNLSGSIPKTIGDVIDAINNAGAGVKARINDTGDGIALVDTAGGSGTLKVTSSSANNAAKDLKLLGDAKTVTIDGDPKQVIDGSLQFKVDIDADDTLADVVKKINDLNSGVKASIISDGTGANPHRLQLVSSINGQAGEVLVDDSKFALKFQTTTKAHDALLLVGSSAAAGVLSSSDTNNFENAVEGLAIAVNGDTGEAVTLNVTTKDSALVDTVKLFVTQYNALRDKLKDLTAFNATTNSTGLLFGSNEALRVDNDISRLMTSRFFGAGEIQSLEEVGLSLGQDGKLSLDESKLKTKFNADPEAVTEFFTKKETGVAAKFDKIMESLAGTNSVLVSRIQSLQDKIDVNTLRVEDLNERLKRQQEAMLKEFYNLELAISKLQDSMTAINQIQYIPPLGS